MRDSARAALRALHQRCVGVSTKPPRAVRNGESYSLSDGRMDADEPGSAEPLRRVSGRKCSGNCTGSCGARRSAEVGARRSRHRREAELASKGVDHPAAVARSDNDPPNGAMEGLQQFLTQTPARLECQLRVGRDVGDAMDGRNLRMEEIAHEEMRREALTSERLQRLKHSSVGWRRIQFALSTGKFLQCIDMSRLHPWLLPLPTSDNCGANDRRNRYVGSMHRRRRPTRVGLPAYAGHPRVRQTEGGEAGTLPSARPGLYWLPSTLASSRHRPRGARIL